MKYIRGRKKQNNGATFRWIYFLIFLIILTWLLLALFMRKDPRTVVSDAVYSMTDRDNLISLSDDEWRSQLQSRDKEIESLEKELSSCKNRRTHRLGMIDVENKNLNLRKEPSLSSDILLRIPDSSEVKILYFDKETFFLDDKPGNWCRVQYAEEEGWVWGNYIKIIE